MRIEPLGDLAYILRNLDASPPATALSIELANIAGITDVVPCAETVGVYFESAISTQELEAACHSTTSRTYTPREIRIPVCYEIGEDLARVADALKLDQAELVDLHSSADYDCFAVGFCPGFAYLGPLPAALRGVPRLASPRVRTEPGSLGLTGNQTAVYPMVRPGGWQIIGVTPLTVADEADGYFPIAVGDRITFEPISHDEFNRLQGRRL